MADPPGLAEHLGEPEGGDRGCGPGCRFCETPLADLLGDPACVAGAMDAARAAAARLGLRSPALRGDRPGSFAAAAIVALVLKFRSPLRKADLVGAGEALLGRRSADLPTRSQSCRARHLSKQCGWFVVRNAPRHCDAEAVVLGLARNETALWSLRSPYPRRVARAGGGAEGVGDADAGGRGDGWGAEIARTGGRCGTCWTGAGEVHPVAGVAAALEQGHRDPAAPAAGANLIAQCGICNQALGGDFVLGELGLPVRPTEAGVIRYFRRLAASGHAGRDELARLSALAARLLREPEPEPEPAGDPEAVEEAAPAADPAAVGAAPEAGGAPAARRVFRALDLFAGCGGLSEGFAAGGRFEVAGAVEVWAPAAETFRRRHPGVPVLEKDIAEVSAAELADLGPIDVVLGGPPCQSFSTAGKREAAHPRAQLWNEYLRVLRAVEPAAFVFENVRGLLTMERGATLRRIAAAFADPAGWASCGGYDLRQRVLDAADFGAPQHRERLILVGVRRADATAAAGARPPFRFPPPRPGPPVTFAEATSDLPPLEPGESADAYATPPAGEFQAAARAALPPGAPLVLHAAPAHGARLRALVAAIPREGGRAADLPEGDRPASGFKNSYARLWSDRPATTVTSNLGTPSSARCIHPVQDRALTSREGARLQGFPDDYPFAGSRSQVNLQIGNAVPPPLAAALADAVAAWIAGP